MRHLLLFLFSLLPTFLWADNIPVEKAQELAITFFKEGHPQRSAFSSLRLLVTDEAVSARAVGEAPAYYVFGCTGSEGFVIVAGDVMKRFSVKDGWGVIFLRKLNIPVAIMTGENTQIVQKRADKLKIDYCYLGVKDKVAQAEDLCRELGITLQDVAFIGDDVNDLALLRKVGFSASPSNTPDYVKREVDYVTAQHGGFGAFREFVEKLLSDNGMLEGVLQQFLS